MLASAQPNPKPLPNLKPAPAQVPKALSWAEFKRRYGTREDGNTYEWVNGIVEKTPGTMDLSQFYIWLNLNRCFLQFQQTHPDIAGSLITEADVFFKPDLHRRPDIAYFTHAQIKSAAHQRVQVPGFIAEIISANDNANKVSRKVQEYFSAGVKVVWNIYPTLNEVHVFEDAGMALLRRGDDLCSAEAALPGFSIAVSELLRQDDGPDVLAGV